MQSTIISKSISLIAYLLLSIIAYGQQEPYSQSSCREYEIYKVAFEDMAANYKDTLVVEINNVRGPFLLGDIKAVSDFSEGQLEHIHEVLSKDWEWRECSGITELLRDLSEQSPPAIKDTYYKITCSQPVFVSDSIAVLIFSFSTQRKSREGGKAMGADVLDTYVLDNLKWKRADRQALSMY